MSNTKEKNQTVSLKTQSNFMRLGLYLLVVVLLNLASNTFFVRLDLTGKGAYSLSAASKKAVGTLAEPLTIKAFFSKNLPGNYSTLEQTTRDLLEEYAIYGKSKFNFEFYAMGGEKDKSANQDNSGAKGEKQTNEQIAQSYSIAPIQIQSFQEDEVKLISSYMGLCLIHGSQIESIPAINPGENLEYKITSTIQKMNNKTSALLNIKDNIQVKLFLSSHLEQLKTVGPEIEKVVTDLNSKYFGKLQYALIDPDNNKDATAEAEKLNAFGLQTSDRSGKPNPTKSYVGLVITHGDKVVPIPLLQRTILGGYSVVDMEQLKQSIEGSTSKMIGAFQEIGYLTDYGTLSLYGSYGMQPNGQRDQGLSNFNQQINNIYTVKETNLKEGIPTGLKTLIIAGPKQPFSEYDLFQIDQFLMQGNSLAVFLDSFEEKMDPNAQANPYSQQPPMYVPIKTGMEELLKHYGVNGKSAYIMDENCYVDRRPTQSGSYQETPVYYAPKISDKYISDELPFIKNIKQLVLVKTSPLELYQDKIKDGLKAYKLISSSDKSWEMADQIDLYNRFSTPPAAENKKSSPLAYLLEGQFTSYFKGKTLPQKPTDSAAPDAAKNETSVIKETEVTKSDNFIPQSRGGKIFIIGSSTILTNMALGENPEDPNALFLLNTLDHLNDRDDFAVMRSKGESINPLNETSKFAKDTVRNINVFMIPMLGLIAGLIFWFTWENRKKKIQALFSKEQQ